MTLDDVCAPDQAQLLRSLLNAQLIQFVQGPLSKKKAFQCLASMLADYAGSDEDTIEELEDDILQALIARERLGCTAIGKGVAIPHARVETIHVPLIAVLKVTDVPLEYDEEDGTQASFLFALIVPQEEQEKHLQIYAALATCIENEAFENALKATENETQLLRLFTLDS